MDGEKRELQTPRRSQSSKTSFTLGPGDLRRPKSRPAISSVGPVLARSASEDPPNNPEHEPQTSKSTVEKTLENTASRSSERDVSQYAPQSAEVPEQRRQEVPKPQVESSESNRDSKPDSDRHRHRQRPSDSKRIKYEDDRNRSMPDVGGPASTQRFKRPGSDFRAPDVALRLSEAEERMRLGPNPRRYGASPNTEPSRRVKEPGMPSKHRDSSRHYTRLVDEDASMEKIQQLSDIEGGQITDYYEESDFVGDEERPEQGDTSVLVLETEYQTMRADQETERKKGNRRRAVIAGSKFSISPDTYASHKTFVNYTAEDTPIDQYTQIIIWCLHRRLKLMEKSLSSGEARTTAAECARIALADYAETLAKTSGALDWTGHGRLSPRPLAPNPQNESNTASLERFTKHLAKINEEAAQWLQLARAWELKRQAAAEPVPSDSETDPDLSSQATERAVKAGELLSQAGIYEQLSVDALSNVQSDLHSISRSLASLSLTKTMGQSIVAESNVRVRPRVDPHLLVGTLLDMGRTEP